MTTPAPRKVFDAITTSPKSLQTLLQCLLPTPPKSCFVTIRLSIEGLKLVVGGLRFAWQSAAFIESTLFSKYTFTPVDDEDELLLQVNLHAFSECLSMFAPTSGSGGQQSGSKGLDGRNVFAPIKGSVRLVYEGDGQPFLVIAEENGVVTTCELTTYEPDEDEESNEIVFSPNSLVSKIIMKSEWLHSAITELDTPSPNLVLQISTSPQKPHFRLSTTSEWGGAEIDYPNERNVLEIFLAERASSQKYRFAAVKMGLKAMSTGSKVSVRIDGEGVLSMNFMVDVEGKNCFVEFRVIPNVEESDTEDD